MAARHGKTFGDIGPRRFFFTRECSFHLGEYPGVAFGPASDHDRIAACFLAQGDRIGAAAHVPVPHDGDGDAALDLRDDVPVGAPAVELLGVAPVHGDGARPCVFHSAGELGGCFLPHLEPAAELHRDGMFHGAAHRRHDGCGERRVAHERRAVAFRHDLARGAAHVDVEVRERVAHRLLDPCGLLGHDGGLVPEQLHGHEVLPRSEAQQVARLLVCERKALR